MTTHDDWDFYLCKVDDRAASIFLNLALRAPGTEGIEKTLYAVQVGMRHPGDHGMGTSAEGETLHPIEDELVRHGTQAGFRYLGRLRNCATWQMTFMGPDNAAATLERIAQSHLGSSGRQFKLVTQSDPKWSYYRDFLYPSEERIQWIMDRRVVELLEREGDPLAAQRRVDHWATFSDEISRTAFAVAARDYGFEVLEFRQFDDVHKLIVQFHRADSVQLNEIHEVTRMLASMATECGGEYDGWETSVESPEG